MTASPPEPNAGLDDRSLDRWLEHIEGVHAVGIDLGLERVGRVAERMGFEPPAPRPAPRSVIIAGTNGKGSTCVVLESLLREPGLKVGTTLSPHVHVFNERVRIDGVALDDAALCAAFARVEDARGDIPLTYFEFSALVALDCFRRAQVDVAVLEVGLGGRLDAFNLVAADVAVITSIDLDHQAWLGDDVESIGREKAGVMRPGQRVVLGGEVSESVVSAARRLACQYSRLGTDFHVRRQPTTWDHIGTAGEFRGLPAGPLAPANCALAIEAAGHLVSLTPEAVVEAVGTSALPGRMETWRVQDSGQARLLILDVAHNPAGARFVAGELARRYPGQRFVAVLGMLADKDSGGVAAALDPIVRDWICVPTTGPRGLDGETLAERIAGRSDEGASQRRCVAASDAVHGLGRALSSCDRRDGILAFGSFNLVEEMRQALTAGHSGATACAPGELVDPMMDSHL